ncbi:hypothetical protein ACFOWM_03385 [Ferruginibacter yonginensis]|uniref:HK97 gp10 family phage protein n=1 Tax=Ferruginibacter yonginensis TaxID=1310416 RepID=A0ABV8QNQ0_9BACT
MNGDLKQTFILKCVQEYVADCANYIQRAIIRTKSQDTGALLNSVIDRARSSGSSATGELLFKEYGRFLDMGVARGHPLGGLKSTTVNLKSRNQSGKVFVKDNTIKRKKIYSGIVYGKLNYLYSKLSYGFSEAVIASLKQMQNAPNSIS